MTNYTVAQVWGTLPHGNAGAKSAYNMTFELPSWFLCRLFTFRSSQYHNGASVCPWPCRCSAARIKEGLRFSSTFHSFRKLIDLFILILSPMGKCEKSHCIQKLPKLSGNKKAHPGPQRPSHTDLVIPGQICHQNLSFSHLGPTLAPHTPGG